MGIYRTAGKIYEGAAYLKRKKDEYQMLVCSKIVGAIWKTVDKDNVGHVTQLQVEELLKEGLGKVGKPELFSQVLFDTLIDQVDVDRNDKIDENEVAMLLNILLFNKAELIMKAKDFTVDLVNNVIDDPEAQVYLCNKIVDVIWDSQDHEKKGYVTSAECEALIKQGLAKIKKEELYSQEYVDKLMDNVDKDNNEQLDKAEVAHLLNMILFHGSELLRELKIDPESLKEFAEGQIPEKYRGAYEQVGDAVEKAKMLKKEKDEYQQKMCEKIVETIWKQFDQDTSGSIKKSKCEELVIESLAKVGKANLFIQAKFDMCFYELLGEDAEEINLVGIAKVLNLILFKGY